MAKSVTSLRYKVDCDYDGIHPLQEKVETVKDAPKPMTELKSFLRLLTYYSRFLPNKATTLVTSVPIIEIRCKLEMGQIGVRYRHLRLQKAI